MSTSVTPATNTTTETTTPTTPTTPITPTTPTTPTTQVTPTPTPVPVQNTTTETPVTQAVPVPVTTTEIKKDNSKNVEKGIVQTVIQGIFVFIIALLVIGLIGYFLFSHEEEAFRFRELFYPHRELVPKI